MNPWIPILAGVGAVALVAIVCVTVALRRRNIHHWFLPFLRQELTRRRRGDQETVDLLLCIADHFEPSWGEPSDEVADARVSAWTEGYPRLFASFRDSDGRPPRHTFFYPIDQYVPRHVDAIAELCRRGYGEVEIHLHHDGDTAEGLERTLRTFTATFAERHGLLGRHPDGSPAFGFVHGNWALDNSRPDGRWCGVDNELEVLRRCGCYADFTMPSAPDPTQTKTINSIYYASGCPHRRKSHDSGVRVGIASSPPPRGLMMVQGPLRLWWPRGSRGPRIENGCLQKGQAPTMARLLQWMRADVHVPTRPDWLFVKLHTHGATEANQRVLLGSAMVDFHAGLARFAATNPRFRFHYVTAREMYNLAKAAEAGWTGPVAGALDFTVVSPSAKTALAHAVREECAE
jgi:hypothetical protein